MIVFISNTLHFEGKEFKKKKHTYIQDKFNIENSALIWKKIIEKKLLKKWKK